MYSIFGNNNYLREVVELNEPEKFLIKNFEILVKVVHLDY